MPVLLCALRAVCWWVVRDSRTHLPLSISFEPTVTPTNGTRYYSLPAALSD